MLFLVPTAFAMDPLQNGGFETGDFTAWAPWGDETAIVDDAFEGAHAATLVLDPTVDGVQQSGLYQDVVGAVPGDHLQVSLMARAADPLVGGTLSLSWEGYGTGDSDFGLAEIPLEAGWSFAKIDFVVPDGVDTVRHVVLLDGFALGATGAAVIDDLRVSAYVEDLCPEPGDQADSDGDGSGDACDLCEGDDALGDPDGDGACGSPEDPPSKGCATAPNGGAAAVFAAATLLAGRRRRR